MLIYPEPVLDLFNLLRPGIDLDTELNQSIIVGRSWQYDLPPGLRTDDPDIKVVYWKVDLLSTGIFMDYDQEYDRLSISSGGTSARDLGSHQVKFQLIDEEGVLSIWYFLNLDIVE